MVTGTLSVTTTPIPKGEPEASPTATSTVLPGLTAPTATPLPPTATPAPKSYPAPTLCHPENGQFVSGSGVRLMWNGEGRLEADEHFDVRVWRDESTASAIWTDWSDEKSYWLDFSGLSGNRFCWSVRVIRGRYQGGNRVFDEALSPDSERWWIEWSGPPEPTDTPQPTNTPVPPTVTPTSGPPTATPTKPVAEPSQPTATPTTSS